MTQVISPKEAHDELAAGKAILIDVREADEFQEQHISYAQSLPLSNFQKNFEQIKCPEGQKIIFQCLSGSRSMQACQKINKPSHTICFMEGGIEAWKSAGLPVIGLSTKFPIMRQVQMIVGGMITFMLILVLSGMVWALWIAGLLGMALFFAGFTGWCGLAKLLKKMPWNSQ